LSSSGPSASALHTALLVAAGACLLVGLPATAQFQRRTRLPAAEPAA
jgi:hypothetical protein